MNQINPKLNALPPGYLVGRCNFTAEAGEHCDHCGKPFLLHAPMFCIDITQGPPDHTGYSDPNYDYVCEACWKSYNTTTPKDI